MRLLLPVLLLLLVVFGPGLWVKRVLSRYSVPEERYSGTGAELARHLLIERGLSQVRVETTDLGDHYDPEKKCVRLSPENYSGRSLTAITVAAHEVGHAVQDADAYGPLRLRGRLVRATQKVEKLGAAILLLSPIAVALTRAPGLGFLTLAGGIMMLATSTLVHMVTLPTELDASFRRALPMLKAGRILIPADEPHAKKILKAAAYTYVAASLMSLLNIARWIAILRR